MIFQSDKTPQEFNMEPMFMYLSIYIQHGTHIYCINIYIYIFNMEPIYTVYIYIQHGTHTYIYIYVIYIYIYVYILFIYL